MRMLIILQAYLLGQLTCGCQHNDSGQAASLSSVGGVVCQQALHYGQHKGEGLALAGPAQSAEHLSAQIKCLCLRSPPYLLQRKP